MTARELAKLIEIRDGLLDASKRCIGLLETVEAKALVGDEGCLWAVEIMRAAIAKAEGIDATGEQGFAVSGEGTPP